MNKTSKKVAFFIAAVTVLIYLPALQNGFVNFDDDLNVYENPYIRSLDSELLKYMLSFQDTMWVPITRLSHALNYAVWELDPMGHHLTNIVFHGFNTFLVVILIFSFVENIKSARSSSISEKETAPFKKNALIAGGVTGIFFGIHPLHVESVAWVTERKDVLSGFFVLLSLFYYYKFVTTSLKKRRRAFYIFSVVFFAMALMSKPMAVTLPAVLVILDIYPLERLKFSPGLKFRTNVITEKIPFFALSLALSTVTILSYQHEGVAVLKSNVLFTDRLLVSAQTLCFYLYKILWPVNLAPLYPYPSKVSIFTLKYAGAVILVLGITLFCIFSWKKQKVWTAVWTYYVVTLLPVLGIIKFGDFAAANRYTYLPNLGPFLLIGLGVARLIEYSVSREKGLTSAKFFSVASITAIVLVLFSGLTVRQIKTWKDSETLWKSELKIFPDNVDTAYVNLGMAYEVRGDHQQAINNYNKAVKIKADAADAYYNRGISYANSGNYKQAVIDLSMAIKINPQYSIAYNNRGVFHGILGNYQQSIEDLDAAIRLNPGYTEAYYNRGVSFSNSNQYKEALQDFNKVIQMNPAHAKAYYSRGYIYKRFGDYRNARKDFISAARLGNRKAKEYLNVFKK